MQMKDSENHRIKVTDKCHLLHASVPSTAIWQRNYVFLVIHPIIIIIIASYCTVTLVNTIIIINILNVLFL